MIKYVVIGLVSVGAATTLAALFHENGKTINLQVDKVDKLKSVSTPIELDKNGEDLKSVEIESGLSSNSESSESIESAIIPVDESKFVSNLANYPGFDHNIDRDEGTYSSEETKREKKVTECMLESGFEYTPSTSMLIDDDVLEDAEAFEELLEEMSTDPNEVYISTLTEARKRSYYLALYGVENPDDEEAETYDLAASSDSCVSRSFQEIPGVYAKRNILQDQLDIMEENISKDPTLTAAIEKWSVCMSENGYDLSKPQDLDMQADSVLMNLLNNGGDSQHIDIKDLPIDSTIMGIVSDSSLDNNAKLAKVEIRLGEMQDKSENCIEQTSLSSVQVQARVKHENEFVENNLEKLK